MKKKLAYVLTAVLVLTLIPTAVYAGAEEQFAEIPDEEEDKPEEDTEEEPAPEAGISLEDCFPDTNFRAIVEETYDVDKDGYLSDEEIQNGETCLMVSGEHIESLSGIEYLTQLLDLECTYNDLTSLDLSGNPNLESLYCESGQLTSLNLGAGIRNVYCSDNQLTSLDVSACTQLRELMCEDNPDLTSLRFGESTPLVTLDCSRTGISSLDLGEAENLENLNCDDCSLDSLSVSNFKNLKVLSCARNKLSQLDVTGLEDLRLLNCAENSFTSIKDVTGRNQNLNLGSSFLFYPQEGIAEKKNLQDENCEITLSEDRFVYEADHLPWEPAVTVAYDDVTLEEGVDYSVQYYGNETAGRAGVWVIANEDSDKYIGSRIVYFDIEPQKPSKPKISIGNDGLILKGSLPEDAVGCEVIRDDLKEGQYLDGYLDMDGQKYVYYIVSDPGRVNGKTYYYRISSIGLGDDSCGWAYSQQSDRVPYLYLSKPSLKSAKRSSDKAMTVKWGKNTKCDGYEVQYAAKSSFGNAKSIKVKGKKTTTKKITGLKKQQVYYVRVRAYKKSGKTTYYSGWSGSKTVGTRK